MRARALVVTAAALACLPLAGAAPARADVVLGEAEQLKLTGDLRLRLEADWDSQQPDGTPRADRTRARYRGRVGLEATPQPGLSLGLRLRSGSAASQQSPHITFHDFDGNSTGDHDVLLDKWFARVKRGSGWAWAGRNSSPFWKQNELYWDDDVTPAGLAGGYDFTPGEAKVTVNAGYFTLPDGGRDFHGRLGAGQVVYATTLSGVGLTAAGSLYLFEGEEGATHLRNGNGLRDYSIGVASLEARWPAAGRPLALGLDLIHNAEGYSAADDPFTAAHRDETDGFAVQATLGQLKQQGDWLVAYTWADVETLAVNASFAQDDWVRWGSATQTDGTDLKGHELRLGYVLGKSFDLSARLFLVEAITSRQDGKRFRLDLNYKL